MFVTTTLALFTAVPRVSADSNVQKVIDETLCAKPIYVLGYSLDQKSKIEQTLNLLNYDSSKDKKRVERTMTPEAYSSIT